jgi:hypothetical protein
MPYERTVMSLPPDPYQDPNHPLYGQTPPTYHPPGYAIPPGYYEQYPQHPMQYVHPQTVTHKQRKNTSHGVHLTLTILTCGLWGLCVWAPIAAWHAWGPRSRSVTKYR